MESLGLGSNIAARLLKLAVAVMRVAAQLPREFVLDCHVGPPPLACTLVRTLVRG